ncbi:MAG TPA: PadR family transcriptional regulator [Solirubrobacterales bacterium]|jgi:DNA-binding PadR family transcriptional regulator|nr:PadR family transcriptional regulator [Solirubrobacterales bacterium]
MSSEIRLTPTSFIVLGLLEAAGEATPYELKQVVAAGLGDFWSIQHAQLYSEPERLAKAGYLSERREEGGRRRRHYGVTAAGRKALRSWLEEPTAELTELRDPGLLKLFFGADPKSLAEAQVPVHRRKLAEYEELQTGMGAATPAGVRLSLVSGVGHEREWVRFWSKLAE